MGKVTKEQVENAKAAYAKARVKWRAAANAAEEAADEAWDKYMELKREFENGN